MADWHLLTRKVSLLNCFSWFVRHFQKILCKKSMFQAASLGGNPLKVDFDTTWTLTFTFSSLDNMFCFKKDFAYMLLLKKEVQINKNNYETMLFMSKQVSLPKTSSILKNRKIGLKSDICPFCTKAFNYKQ